MELSSVKRLAVSREKLTTIDPEIAASLVDQFTGSEASEPRWDKEVGIKGKRFQDAPAAAKAKAEITRL